MSELPTGWAQTSLGDITAASVGQRGPSPDQAAFTYIDISSIDRSTKRIVSPQTLAVDAAPSRARQQLEAGDVLVSMTRPNLNAVAMISEDLGGSVGSTGFHILRAASVTPSWLYYRVQSDDFISAMSLKVQGALYPAVRPKDITGFQVELPPLNEQSKVVAEIEKQFSRLDAATAALERVRANLKRYRASVLKAACEGRLVPTEAELARKEGREYEHADKLLERILRERRARWEAYTLAKMMASGKAPTDDRWKQKYKEPLSPNSADLATLPKGWCWASFDQIAWRVRSGTAETSSRDVTEYPVLKSSAVRPGKIDFADVNYLNADQSRPENYVEQGDMLVTRLSGSLEYVAQCALVVYEPSQPIQYPDRLFCAKLVECIDRTFVSYTFQHGPLRAAMERAAKSTAGHQRISMTDLFSFAFPLPPLREQQRIASSADRQVSLVEKLLSTAHENQSRAVNARRSILTRAFSGNLVHQDSADEPASALLERIRRESRTSGSKDGPRRRTRELAHV
jgi:type I restriction enzyme S subunit